MGDHVLYDCDHAVSIQPSPHGKKSVYPPHGEAVLFAFVVGQLTSQDRRYVILSHKTLILPFFFVPMTAIQMGDKEQAHEAMFHCETRLSILRDLVTQINRTPAALTYAVHDILPMHPLSLTLTTEFMTRVMTPLPLAVEWFI